MGGGRGGGWGGGGGRAEETENNPTFWRKRQIVSFLSSIREMGRSRRMTLVSALQLVGAGECKLETLYFTCWGGVGLVSGVGVGGYMHINPHFTRSCQERVLFRRSLCAPAVPYLENIGMGEVRYITTSPDVEWRSPSFWMYTVFVSLFSSFRLIRSSSVFFGAFFFFFFFLYFWMELANLPS